MKSSKLLSLVLMGMAILVLSSPSWGSVFENAPEVYAPAWSTSYPYQRNIDWGFSTDPEGGPTGSGAPGADYSGYDDPFLWDSDFVQFTGDVQWFDAAPGTGTNPYSGVIGIDNRGGSEELSGTAVLHIDNWPIDRPIKHGWAEVDYATGGTGDLGTIWWIIDLPQGYSVTGWNFFDDREIGTDPLIERVNFWAEIEPNPPWEEIVIEFTAPVGDFVFIDRFHIATECIPEPSTLVIWSLLALCSIGIGWRRRRKA